MRAGLAEAARGRSDSTAAAGAADGRAGVGSLRAGRVELAAAGAALGGVGARCVSPLGCAGSGDFASPGYFISNRPFAERLSGRLDEERGLFF